MNKELGLYSIVRPKKPGTKPGKPHKVFENKLKQNFTAEKINQKWCTDFRLVHSFFRVLKYRSIGALSYGYPALLMLWVTPADSQNSTNAFDVYWVCSAMACSKILSQKKESSPPQAGLFHEEKSFLEPGCESKAFCKVRTARSLVMRRSVMLATTLRSWSEFRTEEQMYQVVEEFAYITYNHVRPHSYNGYKPPFEARCA